MSKFYTSPRWSGEICDCSMPLTFDTYSSCAFNCLYCFAFFQKSHCVKGYKGQNMSIKRIANPVNVDRVKKIFLNSLNNTPQTRTEKQTQRYIQDRFTLQWGGMADGFDFNEEEQKTSLELLKFFDKIDYPLSISTKGVQFTKDKEYMDIIKKHSHNWHFKISIITNDKDKASRMEEYVPSPNERFKAMRRLSKEGIKTTLRLRPYIIGLSDDYPILIKKAAKCGALNVTTEFFCLEARANDELKEKYKLISDIVGYDVWEFYKKHSKGAGYKRLNYNIKKPIIKNMRKVAHENKLLFYVSDAHHKEKCDTVCCCGTPPDFKVYDGHFAGALQLAKKRKGHKVYWSDISQKVEYYFGNIEWASAEGFNTGSSVQRSKNYYNSLADWIHNIWNKPSNGKSPYKYFEGVLYPVGLDENNDVIYKYNTKKAKS